MHSQLSHQIWNCHQKSKYNPVTNTRRSGPIGLTSYHIQRTSHSSRLGLRLNMQIPQKRWSPQDYPAPPGMCPVSRLTWKSSALEASQEFPTLLTCFLSDRCSKSCWLTQTGKHSFGFLHFSPLPLAKRSKKWRAEQGSSYSQLPPGSAGGPTTERHVMGQWGSSRMLEITK